MYICTVQEHAWWAGDFLPREELITFLVCDRPLTVNLIAAFESQILMSEVSKDTRYSDQILCNPCTSWNRQILNFRRKTTGGSKHQPDFSASEIERGVLVEYIDSVRRLSWWEAATRLWLDVTRLRSLACPNLLHILRDYDWPSTEDSKLRWGEELGRQVDDFLPVSRHLESEITVLRIAA